MASLSNINGIFDVHSTGAILFSTSHGTSGQILKSNGNAAPTWVAASTVIGGPYLPLTGGTLSGATATATGISFTVGGALSGTSATFSGNIATAADKRISVGTWDNSAFTGGNAQGFSIQGGTPGLFILETDQTNKKSYLAMSGGAMYLGGSINFLALDTDGARALTLDDAQNATFAGIVQVDGSNLGIGGAPANASYGSIGTKLDMKGGADSIIILRGAAGGTGAGAYVASEYGLYAYDGEFMITRTNQSSWWSSPDFKLSGGNATFAGKIGIGGAPTYDIDIANNNGRIRILGSTGYVALDLQNNSQSFYVAREGSTGGNFATGNTAYGGILAVQGNYNLELATNGVVRQTINGSGNAIFAGNVTINGTLTIGGNSAITRSGSTAQGRLAIWQNDTAIKGNNNLTYASQYLTVGVGTTGGFAAIRINAATIATSYLDFTEGASFTKRAQIEVDTNDNMYFRNTSSNTQRLLISSNGTLTSSSSAGSYGIRQNGVSNISNSGYIAGTGTLSFNYDCDSQGSMFIECVFNHYGFISSYGCARIATVANGPNIQVNDIQNISSGNGGSWTFTRVSNTRFTIAKTAGTYGGAGHYFVNIRGNGVKYT